MSYIFMSLIVALAIYGIVSGPATLAICGLMIISLALTTVCMLQTKLLKRHQELEELMYTEIFRQKLFRIFTYLDTDNPK